MSRLMIVTRNTNYLMMSLKEQLAAERLSADIVKPDMKAIGATYKEASGIIIYVDETMASEQHEMVYLRDLSVENDLPLILIDEDDNVRKIESLIPKQNVVKTYTRPINVKQIASETAEYLTEHANQTRKKILVVDDSGAVLRNVKGWLEGKYQVALANSGATAIKYLAMNRPDLVLLDYEMPVVDGKQVLGMIRSEVDFSDIPVIFLTNKDDKESIMNVMALKPNGYLLKSQKPEMIIQAIDDFFEKQKKL